jgi:hypothetical protein
MDSWRSWCRYRRIYKRLRVEVKWPGQAIAASDQAALRARARGLARAAECACGHNRDAHEHYSPGTFCALCNCPQWI